MVRGAWGRVACGTFFLAAMSGAPVQAWGEEPSWRELIDRLIRQLDADSYSQREQAGRQLEALGDAASLPLRRALASGRFRPEGSARAKAVLEKVYVPPCGAVWRPSKQTDSPRGLQPGDVIIRRYGRWSHEGWSFHGVWSRDYVLFRDHDWEPNYAVQLTVWREGKGRFELETTFSAEGMCWMLTYPDDLSVYQRYARKGPWQAQVCDALLVQGGNPRALSQLEAAWRDGCRDAIVLKACLAGLIDAGKHIQALKLAATHAPHAQASRPDGLALYGLLPREIAKAQLLGGRREEALATLEVAALRAANAGADAALSLLRGAQLATLALGSPQAAFEFARQHHKEMDFATLPPAQVQEAAEALPNACKPSEVLAFLDWIQDSPCASEAREVCRDQLQRAAKWEGKRRPEMRPVLVDWHRGTHQVFPAQDRFVHLLSFYHPAEGRIEWEVKLHKWLEWTGHNPGFITVAIYPGPNMSYWPSVIVAVDRFGGVSMFSRTGGMGTTGSASGAAALDEWHKVALDVRLDSVRIEFDGRRLRTHYEKENACWCVVATSIFAFSKDALGAVRNAKYYILTPAEVDASAVESALDKMQRAMIAGEPEEASRYHHALQSVWARAPEAKAHADLARQSVEMYRRLFSPEGLRVCTKEVFSSPVAKLDGEWELDGEWIVARTPGYYADPPSFELPLLTSDLEITGVLSAQNSDPNSGPLILWDGKSVPLWAWCPNAPAWHMRYVPSRGEVFVGGWQDRGQCKTIPHRVREGGRPTDPMPFCLRVRGRHVALFVNQGDKPALLFTGPSRDQDAFRLATIRTDKPGAVFFGRVVLRALPKDKELTSPAVLPSLEGLKPPVVTSRPAE